MCWFDQVRRQLEFVLDKSLDEERVWVFLLRLIGESRHMAIRAEVRCHVIPLCSYMPIRLRLLRCAGERKRAHWD